MIGVRSEAKGQRGSTTSSSDHSDMQMNSNKGISDFFLDCIILFPFYAKAEPIRSLFF
jgi:hypothetical protein